VTDFTEADVRRYLADEIESRLVPVAPPSAMRTDWSDGYHTAVADAVYLLRTQSPAGAASGVPASGAKHGRAQTAGHGAEPSAHRQDFTEADVPPTYEQIKAAVTDPNEPEGIDEAMSSDFTEADVEAVAAAAWSSEAVAIHGAAPWDRQTEARRETFRTGIRAGLAAVVPALRDRWRAEALRDASEEIEFLSVPPIDLIGDEAVGEAIGLLRAANVLRARAATIERSGGDSDE
jgi:hypothetical protein